MKALESPRIRTELLPGDMGAIVGLHGVLYAREYGLDNTFEAYVASPLAEFVMHHGGNERIWVVEHENRVKGSIAIVSGEKGDAQLRWFLLDPDLRGKGMGNRLIGESLSFSRAAGYPSVYLWTLGILEAAIHLYRKAGFVLTEEKTRTMWGRKLTEQRYELSLETMT